MYMYKRYILCHLFIIKIGAQIQMIYSKRNTTATMKYLAQKCKQIIWTPFETMKLYIFFPFCIAHHLLRII